jgi:hypothetical protein
MIKTMIKREREEEEILVMRERNLQINRQKSERKIVCNFVRKSLKEKKFTGISTRSIARLWL